MFFAVGVLLVGNSVGINFECQVSALFRYICSVIAILFVEFEF